MVLKVKGLTRLPRVREVDFDLHRGEVLGIGGLVGAGRTELARLVYGADRTERGAMWLNGSPFAPRNPAAAVKAGLGLVPEERRGEGLILAKSVGFNLHLSSLSGIVHSAAVPLISGRRQRASSERMIADLAIKTGSAETPGRPAERRQSAEGRHRTMAPAQAQGADPRRADARRRHRSTG